MVTYLIMGIILLFLALDILWGAKLCNSTGHFFDKENSNAMRGFWCIIVVLVHIPLAYQNRIQDMIGSFGYIGVTFFFMTSGYGLTLSNNKNHSLKCFWRKRLPKLLITNWTVNLFFQLLNLCLFKDSFSFPRIFMINGWVQWLLGCYFIFWLTQLLLQNNHILAYRFCMIMIVIASLIFYILITNNIWTRTTWTTECYGFIWGILLVLFGEPFVKFVENKWIKTVIISCISALIFGVAYLKFKPILFFGNYLLKIVLGVAITAFILICNVKIKFGNKMSLFLGGISYEIYLIHGYVFHLLSNIKEDLQSGWFILIAVVLTIAFSFVIHKISNLILDGVRKIPIMKP